MKFQKGHKVNVGKTGRHWKVKNTSKMKGKVSPKQGFQKGHHRSLTANSFKKGHHINLGKKQTKEHIEKVRIKREVWKNTKEYVDYINKRRELTRERNIKYPNKKFSNTKIEQKIATELTKRGIYFQQNIGLSNIANVDFYLPEYRIVIEADGCLYHACQQCGFIKYYQDVPLNDIRKMNLLKFNGFNVYHFWEHEINKSPEECINKIKELCIYQRI